jgi:signal transduction histidine kinase
MWQPTEWLMRGPADADISSMGTTLLVATRRGSVTATRRVGGARRPRRWQHAFFYSWLVLAAGWPLSELAAAGRPVAVPLVLIAAMAGWYAVWQVLRPEPTGPSLGIYLAGAVLLWLVLVAADRSFLLVGLNILAPYCLHSLPTGLLVVASLTGGWLWLRLASTGSLSWPEIVIAALIAVSGSTTVGYISSLARTSAERQRLLDQLQAAQAARAAAERRAGVAAERQRVSRDLHDTVTQGLTSVVMLLEAAEESQAPADPASPHVTRALRAARDSLTESRRVVRALRPTQLADADLPDALRRLTAQLSDETGMRTQTTLTGTARPLNPHLQTALLRIAQEAVSNVRRHAHATQATLTLSYMDDLVALDVHDDGEGFDTRRRGTPDGQPGGVGLRIMRERVSELGGAIVVESRPGGGTTVAATVPVDVPTTADPAPPPDRHEPVVAGPQPDGQR